MTELIIIRGAPASGKTTISKNTLKELKIKYKKDCAYISEDNFRKEMQFKYKANDLIAHTNSVKLITTIIKKLIEIDNYEFIIIEGLFRYKEVIESYEKFSKENELKIKWIELKVELKEIKRRDEEFRNNKSNQQIDEIKKDIEKIKPENNRIINANNKSIEELKEEIIKLILE